MRPETYQHNVQQTVKQDYCETVYINSSVVRALEVLRQALGYAARLPHKGGYHE